jgi:hypothetical protein
MTDQTSAEIVLLPCPFCGGTDIDSLVHLDWVACNGCGAALEDVDPSARELWNTRPAASLIEALSAEKAKKRKLIEFVSCLRQHEIDLEVRDELLKLICALAAESTVARLTSERDAALSACKMVADQWAGSGVTRAQAGNAVFTVLGRVNCEWFDPALRQARQRAETAEFERDEARKEVERGKARDSGGYAPDGKTWKQALFAEAERRGIAEARLAEAVDVIGLLQTVVESQLRREGLDISATPTSALGRARAFTDPVGQRKDGDQRSPGESA